MVMTVTPRRERRERELRRKQREKRGGRAPDRGGGGGRGWLVGLGVIVVFVVALLGLRQAGILTALPLSPSPTPTPLPSIAAVDPNDPARGTIEEDQGNTHVNPGTPVAYKGALPPSSGQHWPQPAAPLKAGVYDSQVPNEAIVHNLEHGGIVIAYDGLSLAETDQLKQFVRDTVKTRYAKILLEPYAGLQGGKVTVLAWRWRLNLPSPDTTAILKFISVHYDGKDAPEPGVPW
jgi:hypothetical protein